MTIAKQDTFEEMERAAVRLAKLVGYVSAGTVECMRFSISIFHTILRIYNRGAEIVRAHCTGTL